MACQYGDCDALWSIWPILFFCGVPFVAYAAVQANMWKSEEILKKDSHMQILYGDAIKGNFAETLGQKYPHPLYHLSISSQHLHSQGRTLWCSPRCILTASMPSLWWST